MNYKSAFPSKYLKAADLLEGSDPVTVTIDHITQEDVGFGRDKGPKLVAYFERAKKGLILNVTNANKIAALADNGDTDEWKGLAVELYVTETTFGTEYVDCIRIRRPGGQPAATRVRDPEPESEQETADRVEAEEHEGILHDPEPAAGDDPIPF